MDNNNNSQSEVFECSQCGLHYTDARIAQDCEEWCRVHNSCNVEIAAHSQENKEAQLYETD